MLIIDYGLQDENGFDLLTHIHNKYSQHGEVISVLLCSSNHLPDRQTIDGSLFNLVLERPVTRGSLRDLLNNAFGEQVKDQRAEDKDATGLDYSHLNVMVVEDNKVNQLVVQGLLAKLKIKPVVANNGLQAVEIFQATKERFDFILMDCEMPEMDGWEATRQIRLLDGQRTAGNGVLIVALSAHALTVEREKAALAGMDDYLAKPVSRLDLEKMLKKHAHRLPGGSD